MAILEVLKFPDPRLRKKGVVVEEVTSEMKKLAEDMLETMYNQKGIGLAATQVGQLLRLLVIDVRPKDEEGRYNIEEMTELEQNVTFPVVLFNPQIVAHEGKQTFEEGCLSVPSYFETVERYDYVEVEGLDANGAPITIKTDGLLSVCLQHEMDHLDGKLFIDRLSLVKSTRIKSKIKKFGYPDRSEKKESSNEGVPV